MRSAYADKNGKYSISHSYKINGKFDRITSPNHLIWTCLIECRRCPTERPLIVRQFGRNMNLHSLLQMYQLSTVKWVKICAVCSLFFFLLKCTFRMITTVWWQYYRSLMLKVVCAWNTSMTCCVENSSKPIRLICNLISYCQKKWNHRYFAPNNVVNE